MLAFPIVESPLRWEVFDKAVRLYGAAHRAGYTVPSAAESAEVMKRLASRLTCWHRLPHKSTPRSTRQKGRASHEPHWHRRAQEGLIQAAVSILRQHPPQAEALRTW